MKGYYRHPELLLPLKDFRKQKQSGAERILHISAVRDRVVEQAIVLVLQPIYEKIFHNCSYAYRPGRSAFKALRRVERNLARGRTWVLNLDIDSFFDSVDRNQLIEIMSQQVDDKRFLDLVRKCLDALPDADDRGIAQGMQLSPLLSNVYLHPLDDRMMRAQWNYIRYSDNILVLDKQKEDVERAFGWIREELANLKLTYKEEKTEIVNLQTGFSFLGYRFDERGKGPDRPAVERLNRRVGDLLSRAFEYTDAQMREKLDAILRGWLNYFHVALPVSRTQTERVDKRQLYERIDQIIKGDEYALPRRIIKAALAYQLGDMEAARANLQLHTLEVPADARVNFEWGVLCDLLGMPNEAMDSYLTAFRLQPDHTETAFRIGLYYLKRQQHDKAIRYLQKAVQNEPNSALYQFTLGMALQNYSLNGAARKALNRAYELDPQLKKISAARHRPKPAGKDDYMKFSDQDIQLFLGLFSGREGVHARQWVNNEGKSVYTAVRRPMRAEDVRSHLQGDITLGLYIMRMDNTVNQLVFDIDVTKQVRTEVVAPDGDLSEWRAFVWKDARLLLDTLQGSGITGYAEDSGFKGVHIWVFFDEPQPARQVINFARHILGRAGAAPPGLHREIFPDQASVNPRALGPLVKLPMGFHRLTNRRCVFLSPYGDPVGSPFVHLQSIEKVSSKTFATALEQIKSPFTLDKARLNPADQAKIDKIFRGCNVLRYLQEKAERENQLTHIDRLTLLGVLAHLGETGRFRLHEIIGHTLNYSFRITEKWLQRKRGYPLSCPKIRIWQSDITPAVGCYCHFPDRPGNYPSPLLHADPEFVAKIKAKMKNNQKTTKEPEKPEAPKKAAPKRQKADKSQSKASQKVAETSGKKMQTLPDEIEDWVQDYLRFRKQKIELERKIQQLEEKLNKAAQVANTDRLETSLGVLRRMQIDDTYKWMLEL